MRAIAILSNPIIREGLCGLLAGSPLELVGVYASLAEAAGEVGALAADAAFIDARALEAEGLAALTAIRSAAPGMGLVLLGLEADEGLLLQAIHCGVSCYLHQDLSRASLLLAAEAAARGFVMADRMAMGAACRSLARRREGQRSRAGAELSPREREVLALLREGLSNREIAQRLAVTTGTVRTHVSNILAKLGLRDRVQAAVWAAKNLPR